ncbi:MAG: voltage-gated potassium channel Kch [Marivirga sp.]|jgi:voltage-gated potassium channel Kch
MNKNFLRYHFENKITKSSNFVLFLLIISALTALIMVAFQYSIGVLEQNNFINSWWDSLTSIISIGDGNSLETRIVNFLFWCLNIAISGTIIAFLTTKVSGFIFNLNKGHSIIIDKDHYVIIGWNPNILKIFKEIENGNDLKPTILCFNSMDNVEMRAKIDLEYPDQKKLRILTRTGDCYNISELGIANLQEARSVIVLDDMLIENYNIETTILAIRKNIPKSNVPIIAQFADPTNIKILSNIRGNNIIGVHTNSIIASVTSQSIRNKYISMVFMDFLDFDGDEIYFYSSEQFVGLNYMQASLYMDKVTLIGIVNNKGEINLNPNKAILISDGDQLVVIAADDLISLNIEKDNEVETSLNEIQIVNVIKNDTNKKAILFLGWSELGQEILNKTIPFLDKDCEVSVAYRSDLAKNIPFIDHNDAVNISLFPFDKNKQLITSDYLLENNFEIILILGYNDCLSEEVADTFSLMQNLHLKSSLSDISILNKPRIVLQLNDGSKTNLIDIKEDNEFIVSDVLSSLLMTQLADNPKLKIIFDELFSAEGAVIHINPISEYLNITSFSQVKVTDLIISCLSCNETFIGYIENDELFLNPQKFTIITNLESVSVVVLSGSIALTIAI